jgi:hypothetical protein
MRHVDQVSDITPVPEGTRLVHIGPPKTGTSALQGALHNSREAMAKHGVEYAGAVRHSRLAMMAAAYTKIPDGYPRDAYRRWELLAESVRDSTSSRVILSSETLAGMRDSKVHAFVESLGGPVHVALTMRPMASVLASRWQQSVQDELPLSYDEWLEQTFPQTSGGHGRPDFWRRYDLSHQLKLWGPLVGEENITIVILDPENRAMLLETFEALLALPTGTLEADPGTANTSFPHSEIEMLRSFNVRFRADGGDRAEYLNTVREAVIKRRSIPESSSLVAQTGRISTPRWAAEAANEIMTRWLAEVRDSSARIIGDPRHLIVDPSRFEAQPVAPTDVGADQAGDLAYRLYKVGFEHGVREGRRALREKLKVDSGQGGSRSNELPFERARSLATSAVGRARKASQRLLK